jgi:hypothetical protein
MHEQTHLTGERYHILGLSTCACRYKLVAGNALGTQSPTCAVEPIVNDANQRHTLAEYSSRMMPAIWYGRIPLPGSAVSDAGALDAVDGLLKPLLSSPVLSFACRGGRQTQRSSQIFGSLVALQTGEARCETQL